MSAESKALAVCPEISFGNLSRDCLRMKVNIGTIGADFGLLSRCVYESALKVDHSQSSRKALIWRDEMEIGWGHDRRRHDPTPRCEFASKVRYLPPFRTGSTFGADSQIDTKRGKTGQAVWLPLPQPVLDALAQAPTHSAITLCANSHGLPWTVSGFRASWTPLKLRLEREGLVQPGLTLKGLRHTVATILAEMGYDERTIADMLGQKTLEMARHYSRRADKSQKLTAVIEKFDAEVNRRRTKIVKPDL